MTSKDALEIIIQAEIKKLDLPSKSEYEFWEVVGNSLSKQIPKKPWTIYDKYGIPTIDEVFCIECNNKVTTPYCSNCGQAKLIGEIQNDE